jgi:hypothetical protein
MAHSAFMFQENESAAPFGILAFVEPERKNRELFSIFLWASCSLLKKP